MWLVKCTEQPGMVKVWKDEQGFVKLMFEKERDQALTFIVGLKHSIITLPEPSRVLIEEVTKEEWNEEFSNPLHDSPIRFRDFLARFIHVFADTGAGQSSSEGAHIPRAQSSSARGGTSNMDFTGGDGSDDLSSRGVADDAQPQVEVAIPVSDDKKVKRVEVHLSIKGERGENIKPFLYLTCDKKFSTAIESLVTLDFCQKLNEVEKLLDVNLKTRFTLPDAVVVSELKPATCDKRVGVLHDDLLCSYYAMAPDSLELVNHYAVDLSSFDVSTKGTSSSSMGYTLGGELGLPPKLATAKVAGARTWGMAKGKETSTAIKLDSIQSTMFAVSPHHSSKLSQNALSYIAHNQIPLKHISFEESGLHLDVGRKSPAASISRPVSLECCGQFWVMENTVETHIFKASRAVGEFSFVEGKKKWDPNLLIGRQKLKRVMLVNHGFSWELFDGKVFRRILRSLVRQGDSIPGLMDVVQPSPENRG